MPFYKCHGFKNNICKLFKAGRTYSSLSQGTEAMIFMAGALIVGYLVWVIIREVYVQLAIWAEDRDEGVFQFTGVFKVFTAFARFSSSG